MKKDNFECRMESIDEYCMGKYPEDIKCSKNKCLYWGRCEECQWNSSAKFKEKFCKNCIYNREGKC